MVRPRLRFATPFVITVAACGSSAPIPPKQPPIEPHKPPAERNPALAPATGPDQPIGAITWSITQGDTGCIATPSPCGPNEDCAARPTVPYPCDIEILRAGKLARKYGETACVYTVHVEP